ncbi:MAG: 4Fe-4S binding protein, partial [Bacteroidales bacterium]|nr:4Fe-4S binding protein [Bacteroidales bacterium]
GHCSEVCPADAIKMVASPSSGYMVPTVDENRCLGCGKCEYLCPSRPLSAIYVEGREQHINM